MNNVTTSGRLDWSSFVRVPRPNQDAAAYELQPGDVVFNNTNSAELVGKSALFDGYAEPVAYSNHFTRLRTSAELEPGYLASWLNSQWRAGVFSAICNRWIGQAAVSREKLLGLVMPLPPLDEQRRIIAILDEQMAAVERARTAAEQQLHAIQGLPAVLLRRAFGGEL